MKVIHNLVNPDVHTNQPVRVVCDYCGSELEVTNEDVYFGTFGCAMVTCPCCGKETFVEGVPDLNLTKDNLIFPDHFYHCSEEDGAINCFEDELIPTIKKAIEYFRHHKDEIVYGGHMVGNLMVFVECMSGDEEYVVTAAKDFYSTIIPFESKDY